ncbi:lipopolysaccharide biosynthesis protein [Sphingobacterium sp. N143]|uniref:lipopolysaccharide biosynthesis protein n=1 Tax=Sphingobacterium sp. N143 TaxID=2746727 RepID=UPI002578AFE7|nr:lipopolysaccharide biosynthesis protein [Sphingobacterium sp. N143]MDM1295961.1 lipopolysaccharide biosynthesis protein [Sphingobacterium sp. N143]
MAEINQTDKEPGVKEFVLILQNWIKYFISKWHILVIAGLIGAGLGLLYAKFTKPIFTATTTFVLESGEKASGLGQYAGVAAMVGIDLGGSSGGIFQGDNLLELYKSRKMLEAALLTPLKKDSSKLLIDRYLEVSEMKKDWKSKKPSLMGIDFRRSNQGNLQRDRDSILQKIIKDINKGSLSVAKPSSKLSIIKVDVKSEDEIFAKEFNEALVNEVNAFYLATKTKKSLNNIEILQHKTDSVRAVMYGSISTAAAAIDATPNLNPTRQVQRIVPSQRSQFSAETNKAILGQLVQHLEMSKMALMKEAPLIQAVDTPVYPLEKKKVGFIKAPVIGAFLLGLLTMIWFTVRRLYTSVTAN